MTNHFNILVKFKSLANAAAFLQSSERFPRSRNNLVNQCVEFLEELAETKGVAVATDEISGVEFLIKHGLAGEVGKAAVAAATLSKRREISEEEFIVQQVVSNIKESRKKGIKSAWEPPPVTEADVLEAAKSSAESGETLEQFHEFALAAFGSSTLKSEALREKLSKLFKKI